MFVLTGLGFFSNLLLITFTTQAPWEKLEQMYTAFCFLCKTRVAKVSLLKYYSFEGHG